jgi:hypothetical protein
MYIKKKKGNKKTSPLVVLLNIALPKATEELNLTTPSFALETP